MTTPKLLWGMMWRGGAFGLIAGTMLGAAYGALFANALFLFELTKSPFEFQADYVGPGAMAMGFLALIGMIMGALFGVPTGALVGGLNGLLLGILTRVFFFPPKNTQAYGRTIASVSMVFTALAAWLCFVGITLFYANRELAQVRTLVAIVLLPALLAGVCAGLMSRVIARWYETESAT